jgi:peroxiredoxin
MAQLRQDYAEFINRDTEIIAIGPESTGRFQQYWKSEELPFIGLPNPSHSVIKLYGQEINLFKLGRMPAQAIIDRQGMVRYIHYGHDMTDIPENRELFELLDELNKENPGS